MPSSRIASVTGPTGPAVAGMIETVCVTGPAGFRGSAAPCTTIGTSAVAMVTVRSSCSKRATEIGWEVTSAGSPVGASAGPSVSSTVTACSVTPSR